MTCQSCTGPIGLEKKLGARGWGLGDKPRNIAISECLLSDVNDRYQLSIIARNTSLGFAKLQMWKVSLMSDFMCLTQ